VLHRIVVSLGHRPAGRHAGVVGVADRHPLVLQALHAVHRPQPNPGLAGQVLLGQQAGGQPGRVQRTLGGLDLPVRAGRHPDGDRIDPLIDPVAHLFDQRIKHLGPGAKPGQHRLGTRPQAVVAGEGVLVGPTVEVIGR
jgi:hypothetical protein